MSWFGLVAAMGLTAGCLTTLAPSLRAGDHHRGLDTSTPDETCMACHEPEQVAMTRLRELPASARVAEMNTMMERGGASLVAQWMIDDPRGCVVCHEPGLGLR